MLLFPNVMPARACVSNVAGLSPASLAIHGDVFPLDLASTSAGEETPGSPQVSFLRSLYARVTQSSPRGRPVELLELEA